MNLLRTATVLLLAQTALFGTSSGFAPLCVPGTLASYIALPPVGCTIADDVKVMDFNFNVVAVSGVPVTASQIFVSPVFGPPSRYGLNFSSPMFSVTGSDFGTYEVTYIFDPSDIRSLEDVMTVSSPVFPGVATVDTFGCLGSGYIPNCPGTEVQLTVFHSGTTFDLLDRTAISPPQNILGIRNVIDLKANGASADFDSFENAVYLPEPATWITALAGSAFLALRRRFCR